MYFNASSVAMSRKRSSSSLAMMMYPDVGFGVVGTKTAQCLIPLISTLFVTSPMAYLP